MKKLQLFLTLVTVLTLALGAFAQVQNGQFTGLVTDPSGAAIANAKVAVVNLGTNYAVSTTTNSSGQFSAKELPVGNYKISVEAPGFKTSTNASVALNAGTIEHVDFKMQLGETKEVVEVTGEAAAVETEDSKLATTVGATQIANLPLNGRNVYDLMQLAPGAVNVNGVDFENGHGTVVNGVRENFNGFLINGVNNKGLSGGAINTPIEDTVQEFQQLTLNNSAQYGSSAGAINNLVTKSGTNSLHGTGWYYGRNDALDANTYFLNQTGTKKPPVRFSQFGGTIGGALIKDKLFFFGAYQYDHFLTSALPTNVTQEDPAFRSLVETAFPNSVSTLLYKNFVPAVQGTPTLTMNQYVTGGASTTGFTSFSQYLCGDNYNGNGAFGADPLGAGHLPAAFAQLFGYQPADDAGCTQTAASLGVPYNVAGVANRNVQMVDSSVAVFKQQTQGLGNLFNGKEWSGRLDYTPNSANRFSVNYNWFRSTDSYGPCAPQCARGFTNPSRSLFPNGQFSWTHTFSPTLLNEFRAGYLQNNTSIGTGTPGVPQATLLDGSTGFGSYNGYPQYFKENIYQYSDMVSLSHGNHNMKMGVDIRRNIENSEFNVARPSYYFYDPLFFAIDQPLGQVAGVDPGICKPPCATFNQAPVGQLASNVRHWRNYEGGVYFQDDWKVNRRLTLNLGLRWDKYQRHNELNNLTTTFLKGPGTSVIDNISTGQGWLQQANSRAGVDPNCLTASQVALAQLATVCGPGGFAAAKSLGTGRNKDFGPRVGFAYDVFGDGKMSVRGGFGVSYEGTLYNPLSNSRWNLPYYSFNIVNNFLGGGGDTIIYGPTTGGPSACPNCGTTPTYTGAPTNIGQGTGAQAVGNLSGWQGTSWTQGAASGAPNSNLAFLTGIIFPTGVDDPYVYNFYLSTQRELPGKWVVEADYVGTAGHKLFRSEDINRKPGARLPSNTCVTDNLGRNLCSLRQLGGLNNARLNPNYGRLRAWQNVVNSNYNALQFSAKKQVSHGLLFNVNYTYSHTIDNGSSWHNAATSANGAAAGDGFTTDQTAPGLDRGNAIFDIRNRLVLNYVWQIPGPKHGVAGVIAGGWQYSGIWSFQSGAHWEPYNNAARALTGDCSQAGLNAGLCINRGGDYNLDRVTNDRPNSTLASYGNESRYTWANGWCNGGSVARGPCTDSAGAIYNQAGLPVFSAPCPGCVGNLGRNTFLGPGQWYADMTLAKNFKLTERFNLKFEAQGFNVFNRANFLLATAGGGANNNINSGIFGKAAGTLNARNLQFGLKLSF